MCVNPHSGLKPSQQGIILLGYLKLILRLELYGPLKCDPYHFPYLNVNPHFINVQHNTSLRIGKIIKVMYDGAVANIRTCGGLTINFRSQLDCIKDLH